MMPSSATGSPTPEVIAIPAHKAMIYWAQAKEFIWPAFEEYPGEMAPEDVLKRLLEGRMLLWIAWEDRVIGGVLTDIFDYADFKAVRLIALGGERFEDWREPLDILLDDFAKLWNCRRIEFYGRKGWAKRLPNYKLDKIMMVRDAVPS